jgi:large subunit ribosomal protein L15
MPVNKRSKYRGSRTCGGGTHKNRRGAGNRGGRGNSGGCKHHFVRVYLERGYVYRKMGFRSLKSPVDAVIDVSELDQMAQYLVTIGKAQKSDGAIVINVEDLGIQKILGGGKVTQKLHVTAKAFSEQAISKIEAQGGQTVVA